MVVNPAKGEDYPHQQLSMLKAHPRFGQDAQQAWHEEVRYAVEPSKVQNSVRVDGTRAQGVPRSHVIAILDKERHPWSQLYKQIVTTGALEAHHRLAVLDANYTLYRRDGSWIARGSSVRHVKECLQILEFEVAKPLATDRSDQRAHKCLRGIDAYRLAHRWHAAQVCWQAVAGLTDAGGAAADGRPKLNLMDGACPPPLKVRPSDQLRSAASQRDCSADKCRRRVFAPPNG